MFFKEWRQKNRLNKLFGKYLPKGTVDQLLAEESVRSSFSERTIFAVLISFGQEENMFEEISRTLEALTDLNCIFEELNPVYVRVTIGSIFPLSESDLETETFKVMERLRSTNSWHSIVFGRKKARIGNIGTQRRMSHCSVYDGQRSDLRLLLELDKGVIKEVQQQ